MLQTLFRLTLLVSIGIFGSFSSAFCEESPDATVKNYCEKIGNWSSLYDPNGAYTWRMYGEQDLNARRRFFSHHMSYRGTLPTNNGAYLWPSWWNQLSSEQPLNPLRAKIERLIQELSLAKPDKENVMRGRSHYTVGGGIPTNGGGTGIRLRAISKILSLLPSTSSKAMSDLIDLSDYRYAPEPFLLLDQWVEFLTDKDIPVVFSRLSLKVLERIEQLEALPVNEESDFRISTSHFDDDLRVALEETVNSPEKREHLYWLVLAVFATQGTGVYNALEMAGDETSQSRVVLYAADFLVNSMYYLDTFSKAGEYYSFPKTVTTHCLTGKAYHFWMSAYFAFFLKKKGYSESVAKEAAFEMGKLYEYFSTSVDRNSPDGPLGNAYYRDWETHLHHAARFGLAMHASAVEWALAPTKIQNMNHVIATAIAQTKPHPFKSLPLPGILGAKKAYRLLEELFGTPIIRQAAVQ
jgi:hypothetical protein